MAAPPPPAAAPRRRGGFGLEILKMSLGALTAHRLRSGLTVLGVIIGVTTVIGMVSLIQGLDRSMARQIQAFGTDVLYIRKFKPQVFVGEFPDSLRRRAGFRPEDKDAILARCPAVHSVSAINFVDDAPALRWRRKRTRPTFTVGADEALQETSGITLERGRFFTAEEVRRRSPVCVLGQDTYRTLFERSDPLGERVRIGRVGFTVIGVLAPRGRFLGENQDEIAWVPYTTLAKHFPNGAGAFLKRGEVMLNASAAGPEEVQAAIDQITDVLRARRGLRADQENDFAVITADALLELYHQITGATYFAMILIASIALLVGGIGVMNVMLISVTERTKEIGLRKALGARRGAILWQFLLEAMTVSGTGGAIGIALGLLIAKLVDWLTPLPSAAPLWSVVLAFGFSLAVGLFFGMYPAVRAASLDPVEALRFE